MKQRVIVGPHGLPVIENVPENIGDILELQRRRAEREIKDFNDWRKARPWRGFP
jgi:hypothetical protein